MLEQIIKQLNKLINVIEVQDFRDDEFVDRELVLAARQRRRQTRAEIMQMCDIFRAKIVDVQPKSVTIEITGNESKIEKFLVLMEPFGVQRPDPHGQNRPRPQMTSVHTLNLNHTNIPCLLKSIPTKTPT